MKAARIHDYGASDVLKWEDAPDPTAGAGQVLVRVKASSVNPVDWKIRSGLTKAKMHFDMPLILGGDIAGVVEAVGEGVTEYKVGDEVIGLTGLVGAYASLVAAEPAKLARKPKNLSVEEAAAVPLVALTAWQAIFNEGREIAGKRVLVHAAAGGVGVMAVQIAKAKGAAYVVATASDKNAEFVKSLGADEVVDFRVTDPKSKPRDIDFMLDLAGNDAGMAIWPLVKDGGVVVRLGGASEPPPELASINVARIQVKPDAAQLAEIVDLIEAGKITVKVSEVFPMSRVGEAHDLSKAGHTVGKIVLKLDA